MKMRSMTTGLMLTMALCLAATQVFAAAATRVGNAIWSDGSLYDTVVTDTSFIRPPEGTTDTIYSFMMSGLMGQRSIAESAPGDKDYNGGRWSVKAVTFTAAGLAALDVDNDGFIDVEMTKTEDLDTAEELGYVVVMDTTIYFECPMLPNK